MRTAEIHHIIAAAAEGCGDDVSVRSVGLHDELHSIAVAEQVSAPASEGRVIGLRGRPSQGKN
jgi:hypothetical protein